MASRQRNPYGSEKRKGKDRRHPGNAPPSWEGVERRDCAERRQTSIAEISYFEWASHFVSFQDHLRRLATGKADPVTTGDEGEQN